MTDLERGVYEHLITRELADRLQHVDPALIQHHKLDPADAHNTLARHIATLAARALHSVPSGDDKLHHQVAMANRIAEAIATLEPQGGHRAGPGRRRQATCSTPSPPHRPHPRHPTFPQRPTTPLSTGALLVNGRDQPRIGHEVKRELASADEVDLLCAFIKWHGLRVLEEAHPRPDRERGGRLRVITTTYIGATDQRALDRLVELGAEVKVSYETRTTRLHAKAWLFRRDTGFSTAYVGSSNLSQTALLDGLEWNVRLSNVEQPHLLDTFARDVRRATGTTRRSRRTTRRGTRDRAATRRSARSAAAPHRPADRDHRRSTSARTGYQREILDELEAERTVHGRWRNLVVMATGTGKTVVAALDYRRPASTPGRSTRCCSSPTARRSCGRACRRSGTCCGDGDFGELLVGGERPREWRHVFASVQSLHALDLDELDPTHFDMVIVDEFHHAEAPTYRRLLEHLRPKVLLGLTATPERTDGADVREWFDGRTAVELRLWEALEQRTAGAVPVLRPARRRRPVDTSRWKRGAATTSTELSNVYTGNDARVPGSSCRRSRDKVADVGRMRALGFCVSIEHAEFMAERFNEAGIPAAAVTSRDRRRASERAARRAARPARCNVLFTVDLFNEGVDIPTVDTVLFLRPTESATVFLQQLGRGLRLADDKACLTVLDFIGGQHAEFRFDLRFRALTGVEPAGCQRDVEHGFPTLPAGCHIELDRVAQELVLRQHQAVAAASLEAAWSPSCGSSATSRWRVPRARPASSSRTSTAASSRRLDRPAPARRLETTGRPGPTTRAGPAPSAACCTSTTSSGSSCCRASRPDRRARPAGDAGSSRLLAMLHFSLWGPDAPRDARRPARAAAGEPGPLRRAARARRGAARPHPPGHADRRRRAPCRCRCTPATAATRRCAAFGMANPRVTARGREVGAGRPGRRLLRHPGQDRGALLPHHHVRRPGHHRRRCSSGSRRAPPRRRRRPGSATSTIGARLDGAPLRPGDRRRRPRPGRAAVPLRRHR